MPATELAEWATFYESHPFGEFRADLRAGIVASVVAQTAGNRKAKPSDFMPRFEERGASASAEDRAREAASVTAAFMKASSRLKHHVVKRKG